MGTHFPFPNPSKLAPPTPSSPRPGPRASVYPACAAGEVSVRKGFALVRKTHCSNILGGDGLYSFRSSRSSSL